MSKFFIMQLLCPLRHCFISLAFDPAQTSEEQARKLIRSGMAAIGANNFCGLCGSRELGFETGKTKFDSLAEAAAFLVREEKKNLATRAIFENLRRAARNN